MSVLPVERASVARAESTPRRDPAPARAGTPFAEMLDAALAPSSAARPLTRPAAADAERAARSERGSERASEAEGVDHATDVDRAAVDHAADASGAARGAPPNGTMSERDRTTGTERTPVGANEPGEHAASATDALVRNAQASAREATAQAQAPGGAAITAATNVTSTTTRTSDAGTTATADEEPASAEGGASAAEARATPSQGEPAATGTTAHAAAASLANAHAATGALVPEMRARLQRVVDRMREEYGHDVQVVETYRGQARQDALYAQGRTAPGPVVTWTRSSNHTRGRAADVMIDGGYGDAQAFATLQRVAREEGLHTLGARDPGHLELKGGAAGKAIDVAALAELGKGGDAAVRVTELHVAHDASAAPATPAPVARVAAVAQPAAVARVAAVAQPAAVARVAAVAVPGAQPNRTTGDGTGRAPATIRAGVVGGSATAPAMSAREGAEPVVAPVTKRGARTEREPGADAGSSGPGADTTAAFGHELAGGATDGAVRHTGGAAPVRGAAPASGSDALARLDQIDLLREGAAARPLSHITLSLDGAGGTTDRVRVALNGTAVGATLELGDATTAHRVSAHLGELQQALEQRGLRTDALQVRQHADVAPDAIAMGRVAGLALERESARSGGNSFSGQQQPAPQREREGRSHPDASHQDSSSPRHRARRDSKEGR